MQKFFQKQREVFITVGFFVILAMLVYFVIMPLLIRINSVNDQIQEEKIKQEIRQQKIEDLPKMEEQYKTLQENKNQIDVLFDKENAVTLIEKLEKLAHDSGNSIIISIQDSQLAQKTIPVSKNKKDSSLEKIIVEKLPSQEYIQFKIEIHGEYNTIIEFINRLENFEYYCDIIAIQMKKEDGTNISSNNFGNLNPFILNAENEDKKTQENSKKIALKTVLEVVFYTKK